MEDVVPYILGIPALRKVVSGGQTGVDRAALDAAMALGIEVGGWCPRGRKALDGVIPAKYPLKETRGKSYQTRTRWNVRDSDASLIICCDEPEGGMALTIKCCEQMDKPYRVYPLAQGKYLDYGQDVPDGVINWMYVHQVQVLNVAGPREGKIFPIYDKAHHFFTCLFKLIQETPNRKDCVHEPTASYSVTPEEEFCLA